MVFPRPARFSAGPALTLLVLVLAFAKAEAQPLRKPTFASMVRVADEQLAAQRPYNALEWYKNAYDEEPSDELALKIADLNYVLRDYTSAVRYYERRLRRTDDGELLEARFRLARSQKMLGEYPEAIGAFEEFLRQAALPGVGSDSLAALVTRARLEVEGAQVGMEMSDPPRIAVTNAGRAVNTSNQEYSPVLAADGALYYAGFGESGLVPEYGDEAGAIRLYRADATEAGGYAKGTPLPTEINRPGWQTSNVAVSADGQGMLFVRNKLDGAEVEVSELYFGRLGEDGRWGTTTAVAGVNGDFRVKNPAFGELYGESVIFFASDQPGGQGGYDLYYAKRVGEGQYANAVNLGAGVNTPGDDVTPFYREGTLYFSTDGRATLGGFDVYRTEWSGQAWGKPVNMGKGFNSSLDDRYFQLDASGKRGVLTSNRPPTRSVKSKTCCDDVFLLNVEPIIVQLLATTLDDEGQLLPDVTIDLFELADGDSTVLARKRNPKGNRFDFELFDDKNYVVIARRDGYTEASVELSTLGVTEPDSLERTLVLTREDPPVAEEETVELTLNQPIRLANIYYDYDDDAILAAAEPDLQYILDLMEEYPDMVVELGSHTDVRGEDAYNLDLSQRRAESARQWLLGRGVAGERVVARGYGETEILNQCVNGVRCTDEEHRFNRRTEFKILAGPTTIEVRKLTRTQAGDAPTGERGAAPSPRAPERSEPAATPGAPPSPAPTTTSPAVDPAAAPATPDDRQGSAPVPGVPKIDAMSSLAQETDLTGVPILRFDAREVDLGTIRKGETREHTFRFFNAGTVAASIGIVSACECTTLDWTRGEIAPGAKGEVHAVFDSSEKDAGEIIGIDIVLDQEAPSGNGIIERVQYAFELEP